MQIGAYHLQTGALAIEAPERNRDFDLDLAICHEFTHLFLTELSDIGCALRMALLSPIPSVLNHPTVSLLTNYTFALQEVFATNVEVLRSAQRGIQEERILDGMPSEYKRAYFKLADLHRVLNRGEPESMLLVLQLGLLVLGHPILVDLAGKDFADWRVLDGVLSESPANPEYRLDVALDTTRRIISRDPTVPISTLRARILEEFPLPWRVVNGTSVREYAESLDPNSTVYTSATRAIEAYAPQDLPLEELYVRTFAAALRRTSIHFSIRLPVGNLPLQQLTNMICSENRSSTEFTYVHIVKNPSDSPMAHGNRVIPVGKALVLLSAYSIPLSRLISGHGRSFIEIGETTGLESATANGDELEKLLRLCKDSSNCFIVVQAAQFDFEKESLGGVTLGDRKTAQLPTTTVVMTPWFSFLNLSRYSKTWESTRHQFKIHLVDERDEGVSYFCLRNSMHTNWIFIAPTAGLFLEEYIEDIRRRPSNLTFCMTREEFGLDQAMDAQIITFIRHFVQFGW